MANRSYYSNDTRTSRGERAGSRPFYSGGNSATAEEAVKKKRGGSVAAKAEGGKVIGKAAGGRLDKRARGGAVKAYASGGRAGADKNPFSSARLKGG